MKAWLIPISLCLLAETARADQCAWIDEAAALKAQSIVKRSSQFIEFCEPCGDKAPGAPQLAKTVEVNAAGDQYQEVSINGKPIDLAYVFVNTSGRDARFENLAKLAGCPATGVSASLEQTQETPNGVLITPDPEPAAPPPPPPPAQMTPVTAVPSFTPAVPPAPPPQVYVYTTTTQEIPWLAIVLAVTGGFVTGSTLMFALLTLRRRRDMRPRAMDIASGN